MLRSDRWHILRSRSEQTENGADQQVDDQTDQETHESAQQYVADLVLVRRHVDDDDQEQYDQAQEPTQYPCCQETDDESDERRRVLQIEAFLLCQNLSLPLVLTAVSFSGSLCVASVTQRCAKKAELRY